MAFSAYLPFAFGDFAVTFAGTLEGLEVALPEIPALAAIKSREAFTTTSLRVMSRRSAIAKSIFFSSVGMRTVMIPSRRLGMHAS